MSKKFTCVKYLVGCKAKHAGAKQYNAHIQDVIIVYGQINFARFHFFQFVLFGFQILICFALGTVPHVRSLAFTLNRGRFSFPDSLKFVKSNYIVSNTYIDFFWKIKFVKLKYRIFIFWRFRYGGGINWFIIFIVVFMQILFQIFRKWSVTILQFLKWSTFGNDTIFDN